MEPEMGLSGKCLCRVYLHLFSPVNKRVEIAVGAVRGNTT